MGICCLLNVKMTYPDIAVLHHAHALILEGQHRRVRERGLTIM